MFFLLHVVWLQGDASMEIKRQITGMMRLLSDRSGRVFQRVGSEQNSSTKEPKDHLNCTPVPSLVSEDPRCNNWSSAGDPDLSSSSTPNDPAFGQYGTRSRALRIHNSKKEPNGRVTKRVQPEENYSRYFQFSVTNYFVVKAKQRQTIQDKLSYFRLCSH